MVKNCERTGFYKTHLKSLSYILVVKRSFYIGSYLEPCISNETEKLTTHERKNLTKNITWITMHNMDQYLSFPIVKHRKQATITSLILLSLLLPRQF